MLDLAASSYSTIDGGGVTDTWHGPPSEPAYVLSPAYFEETTHVPGSLAVGVIDALHAPPASVLTSFTTVCTAGRVTTGW